MGRSSQLQHVKSFEVVSVSSPHFISTRHPAAVETAPSGVLSISRLLLRCLMLAFICFSDRRMRVIGWEHELSNHPLSSQFSLSALGYHLTVHLEKNTGLLAPGYFQEKQQYRQFSPSFLSLL